MILTHKYLDLAADRAQSLNATWEGLLKASGGGGATSSTVYTCAGSNYADPHAVTQIANGVSSSTFLYDLI
jgi:hypothetical protein